MKKKAQGILEYVLVLVIVAAALAAMQLYFRRGIQAAIQVAVDEVGTQADALELDPKKGVLTNSEIQRWQSSNSRLRSGIGIEEIEGWSMRREINQTANTSGYSVSVSQRPE